MTGEGLSRGGNKLPRGCRDQEDPGRNPGGGGRTLTM